MEPASLQPQTEVASAESSAKTSPPEFLPPGEAGALSRTLAWGVRTAQQAHENRERAASKLADGFLRLAAKAPKLDPNAEPAKRVSETDEAMARATGIPLRYFIPRHGPVKAPPEWGDNEAVLAGLLDEPGMMALLGKRGTGKTHMACGLVRRFYGGKRGAWYRRAMDFFLAIKSTYDRESSESQKGVIAKWASVELLVLDEMQVRSDTPWEEAVLTDLIDRRYAALKSTVLISNQEQAAFAATMGPSIIDRLNEDGGIIICDWQSLRGQIARAS